MDVPQLASTCPAERHSRFRFLEEEQGRLATIDSMAELVTRQINTAKTLLEALPDEAAMALPALLKPEPQPTIVTTDTDTQYSLEFSSDAPANVSE